MNKPTEAQRAQALQQFTEYFVKNYPGPDTVIFDPKWHAPKLFNAALSALSAALAVEAVTVYSPEIREIKYKDAFGSPLPSDFVVEAGGVTARFIKREYAETFCSAISARSFVADRLAAWISRHLEKTEHLPKRVDEMSETEAAIFKIAAYHNGFLQFILSALTTSPSSSAVEGEAVAAAKPFGWWVGNSDPIAMGHSHFTREEPEHRDPKDWGGWGRVIPLYAHPAPTPAGDGLQAAVDRWADALRKCETENTRSAGHALDAAEETLLSFASPAPHQEGR